MSHFKGVTAHCLLSSEARLCLLASAVESSSVNATYNPRVVGEGGSVRGRQIHTCRLKLRQVA